MVTWGNPPSDFIEEHSISDHLSNVDEGCFWWSGTYRHPKNPTLSLFLCCILRKRTKAVLQPQMVNQLTKTLQF